MDMHPDRKMQQLRVRFLAEHWYLCMQLLIDAAAMIPPIGEAALVGNCVQVWCRGEIGRDSGSGGAGVG